MLYSVGDKVLDEWVITRTIGEGSYGKVVEIERNEFGLSMKSALKIISIPGNNSELKAVMGEGIDHKSLTSYFYGFVEEIIKEIAIMSKLKGHTNIVTYEDHRVIPHEEHIGWDILIRMELLTSLPDYSEEHEITEQTVIKLGTDILTALEICQKHSVVHRDIKPENIFVSATGDFKLGDFGIARTIEKTTFGMSRKGTYPYMAPEVYQGKDSDILVDMYSLGLVMYRMLNDNRLPFFPTYPQKVTYTDRENALYRRMQGEPFQMPCHGSRELKKIVMKSCRYQKEDRYSSVFQMKEALTRLSADDSRNLNMIYEMTETEKKQTRCREEGTVGLFEQNYEKRKQHKEGRNITESQRDDEEKEQIQKKKNRAFAYGIITILAVGIIVILTAVLLKVKNTVLPENVKTNRMQTEESKERKDGSKKKQTKKEKAAEKTSEKTDNNDENDTKDTEQDSVNDESGYAAPKTQTPETPQTSETSQTPDTPQASETPQTPATPQVSEEAQTPATPQVSEEAQTPDTPQTSQESEKKEQEMLIDGADNQKKPEISIDGAE